MSAVLFEVMNCSSSFRAEKAECGEIAAQQILARCNKCVCGSVMIRGLETDVVDVASEDSLVVELDSRGHGSMDGLDMPKQPLRVRMLLTEISDKDRVTNFKTSDLCMIILTRLALSDSLGKVRPHGI